MLVERLAYPPGLAHTSRMASRGGPMKNPRLVLLDGRGLAASSLLLAAPSGALPILEGTTTPLSGGIGAKDGKDGKDNTLTDVLTFLKFDEAGIKGITSVVSGISSLASVVGWSIAAVSTTKDILTLIGILPKPEDPVMLQIKATGQRVEQIYKYLENTDKKEQYVAAIQWRINTYDTRTLLANLVLSRSQSNVDAVVASFVGLRKAILEMLDPAMGTIAFRSASYGHVREMRIPDHWVDAATPFYMMRSDGAPVDYQADDKDMSTTIWDPGYYLDVLFQAIAMRISSLAALEPAFRSTGYDRDGLRTMYDGITTFIRKWNGSFILTRVVGPIDPATSAITGGHRIAHNPLDWEDRMPYWDHALLPIGVIDQVSGVTSLSASQNREFNAEKVFNGFSVFWVTRTFDKAVAAYYEDQSLRHTSVRSACGIERMEALAHSVWALIVGPNGSEFVDLSDATFSAGTLESPAARVPLSLGVVGVFAGQPGKIYPAARYYQDVTKRFSTPLARRTDVSQIQLGYKLVVSVGGGDSGTAEVVLCDFSTPVPPSEQLPIFPSAPISVTLDAPAATVYDVVQTGVLSDHDEDVYEQTGTLPPRTPIQVFLGVGGPRQRHFLEPRPGAVSLRIDVAFAFDPRDLDQPFVGRADIAITSLNAREHPYGFIVGVEVYETVVAAVDNGRRDVRQTELADTMALHFVPSFLVPAADYFADRAAGYAAMDATLGPVSEKYAKARMDLGPIDPVAQVSWQARLDSVTVRLAEEQMRAEPELMSKMIDRLQVRTPQG